MLSNSDPDGRKALQHIRFSNALALLSPLGMAYTGLVSPYLLPAFYLTMGEAIKAQNAFAEDPSSQNAKRIKNSSYRPFFLLLCSIFASTLYTRGKKCVVKSEEGANSAEPACLYKQIKESQTDNE